MPHIQSIFMPKSPLSAIAKSVCFEGGRWNLSLAVFSVDLLAQNQTQPLAGLVTLQRALQGLSIITRRRHQWKSVQLTERSNVSKGIQLMSNPIVSSHSNARCYKIQKLEIICWSPHRLMNLHFHVSIDNVTICLKVQPQVIPEDENTPTGLLHICRTMQRTENSVQTFPCSKTQCSCLTSETVNGSACLTLPDKLSTTAPKHLWLTVRSCSFGKWKEYLQKVTASRSDLSRLVECPALLSVFKNL